MTDAAQQDVLAMEYALGLTDEADTARLSALLATDRAFSQRVAYWQERFLEIDDSLADALPSADGALWQRIARGIEADQARLAPQRVTAPAARPAGFWNSLPVWRGISALAAGVAVLMAVLLSLEDPARPTLIAVLTTDAGRPGAIVEAFDDGRVRLIPLQAIDVPEGRALQVWTLRSREEGPISVGLLDQARTVRLDLGSLPKPGSGQLFEITLEPETGSPTGRPTGPILMKGLTGNPL